MANLKPVLGRLMGQKVQSFWLEKLAEGWILENSSLGQSVRNV